PQGRPVHLRDVWPTPDEIRTAMQAVGAPALHAEFAGGTEGDEHRNALPVPAGQLYAWDAASTSLKAPPLFDAMSANAKPRTGIRGARAPALVGESIPADHISPAGSIQPDSPAGRYLIAQGVAPKDFNSYGARRCNHEVMLRGTFANIRLRNRLVPNVEGGWTAHQPSGERLSIYDAAMRYRDEGVPLVVIAGKEYGTGSSRASAPKA